MKRVNKKFKPNGCNYRYWFRTYYEQPRGTVIKYYLRDEDNNYTAVCRHKLYLRELVLMITVALCLYRVFTMEETFGKMYTPKYLTLRDNVLSLNLKYHEQSNTSCHYSLSLDNEIIINGLLEPGDSVGNIRVDNTFENGDYPVQFEFKIEDSYGHERSIKKDVLLQVRNTTE